MKRQLIVTAPNHLWVPHLTYAAPTPGGPSFALVLEAFSRMIMDWQVATSLRTDLALEALDMGLWAQQLRRTPRDGLTRHSDRGVQGGFSWSSPQLGTEALSGSSSAGSRTRDSAEAEVARAPEVPVPCRGSARSAVVPQRLAALRAERVRVQTDRPLLVLRGV